MFSTQGRNTFPLLVTVACCLSASRAEVITCNLRNQSLSTSEQHSNIQSKRNPPLAETVFAQSTSSLIMAMVIKKKKTQTKNKVYLFIISGQEEVAQVASEKREPHYDSIGLKK